MTPLGLKLLQIQNKTRSQVRIVWNNYLTETDPHKGSKRLREWAWLMDKIHNLQIQIFLCELGAQEYERIVWHRISNDRKLHIECSAAIQDLYLYSNTQAC